MKLFQIADETRISIVHDVVVEKLMHKEVAFKYGVATSVVNSLVRKTRKKSEYLWRKH